jgi:DNA invertase Pin-like site-specific DNA recombinase
MQSKIVVTVLALAAEIERDFLRSRTREGMAAARAAGKTIGRPRGPATVHFLDAKRDEIARLTALGVPKVSIAKIVGASARSVTTHLQRYPKGNA